MKNRRMGGEGEPAYKIESVDSALRLLLAFRERSTMRVTEAAEYLGVARSTAHRLLTMLQYHGFVSQDRVTRAYRTGRLLVEIGLVAIGDLDVRRGARAHLERLAEELGETANLLLLEGTGVRFIDGVEGRQTVRVAPRTGMVLPAHATAGGKVLLADLSSEELRSRYVGGLNRVTDATITDLDDLERELAAVRACGYATNFEESETGLAAVAVCIRDRLDRAVAGITISAPAARLPRGRVPHVARALADAAARISSEPN